MKGHLPGSRLLIDLAPMRRSRDFRILWSAQLATNLARQLVAVAVPYQVYLATHSSLAVGLIGLAQAVPTVLTGVYGGALADRFERRNLQLVAKAVMAVAAVVLALGATSSQTPLAVLYVVVVVLAAASTLDHSAWSAMVPGMVPRPLLAPAMSIGNVMFQVAGILGPAMAGVMIGRLGPAWVYISVLVGLVPAAVLVRRLSRQAPAAGPDVVLGWRAPLATLGYLRSNRLLVGLFGADLIAMVFGMPTAVFPALALSAFRVGPTGMGLMYAAPAAGALVGSLLSGWVGRVRRRGRAVIWAIAAWGLAIAAFGLAGRVLAVGLGFLFLAGAADLVSTVFRNTMLQEAVPDRMRGRMSAIHAMVVSTGPGLGDLEAGAVAALVNPVFSVVSGGVACVAGVLLLAAWLPELRRYPDHEGPQQP